MVRQDPEVADLAKRFICVRMQAMNGVNLSLFQFEGDLTWMAFFMDAHDRFYARYGGREDSGPESLLTQRSLTTLMRTVLELHRTGAVQTGKHVASGRPIQTPEDIPTMSRLMARRKEKCIHCHDVKVAELRRRQDAGAFTRGMLFTYPTPSTIGVTVDPDDQRMIRAVATGSPAATAGINVGDRLVSADGHRILAAADLSLVLERTERQSRLAMRVERDGQMRDVLLQLSGDWKRSNDPSWRETLHVAGPGAGCWGQKLSADERAKLGLGRETMAVKVTFIWGEFAKKAGLRNNDVIVVFDGIRDDWTIRHLHAHLHLNHNYGDRIALVVRRDGREIPLEFQLPDSPPQDD